MPKCAVLEALLDGEQTWYTAGRTTNCFLLCVLHHLCTWEVHCISFHSAPRGTLVRCVLTSTLARSGQISGNTRTICDYDKLCFTGLHSDDDVIDLILNRLSNTFAEAELTRDNRGSLPLHISICSKADLCYPGIDCSQSAIGCFLLSQNFFCSIADLLKMAYFSSCNLSTVYLCFVYARAVCFPQQRPPPRLALMFPRRNPSLFLSFSHLVGLLALPPDGTVHPETCYDVNLRVCFQCILEPDSERRCIRF